MTNIYICKHITSDYLELKFIWVEVKNNNKSYEFAGLAMNDLGFENIEINFWVPYCYFYWFEKEKKKKRRS